MKIALITDGVMPYVLGGMQRYSTMLAQEFVKQGVELHLFHTVRNRNLEADAGKLKGMEEWLKNSVHAHFIPFPEESKLPGHYIRELHVYSQKALARFREVCADCDFIYAQGLTGLAFAEARKNGSLRIPVGVNVHGYEMFQYAANTRERIAHYMLRPSFSRLNRNADYVFSFPGKIRAIVENKLNVPPSRILEIPNAVGDDWLLTDARVASGKCRFLFVGRYERRKGIEELAGAIRSFRDPHVEFHFVGPIEKEKQLPDVRCIYHGKVTETHALKALYDRCDVLLCPSYAEGMPTVILEAMSRGLAIIATDVGATAEVVSEKNGILLDSPSIDRIADAIQEISRVTPEAMLAMKRCSLNKIRAYTWDMISRRIIDSIKLIIDSQ